MSQKYSFDAVRKNKLILFYQEQAGVERTEKVR